MEAQALSVLGDALADAVVVIDAMGLVCWANRAAEALFASPLEWWLGRSSVELVHPDDLDMALVSLASVQQKQVGSPIELRVATASGWRLMEVLGSRLDGEHTVLVLRDLTQRRRWEIAGDDVARFRTILHHAAALTALLDRDGNVVAVSAAVTRLLGHDPEQICGRPFLDIVIQPDRPLFEHALYEAGVATVDEPRVTAEVQLRSTKGGNVPFELTVVSLLDDPTIDGMIVSGHDITRLRIAQQALEELATSDPLTGLLNRRSFDDALEREWLLTHSDGIESLVVVIDLNRFKSLNDEFGHAAGDEALRQVALALRATVRETDVVGRIGGDEFAAVLVRCGGEVAAAGFAERFETELGRRAWPHGVTLDAAVGHCSLRRAASPAAALHEADVAMLANKPKSRR